MDPAGFEALLAACIARVGEIALALPEAHEEDAWKGVRWRIRQRTFAWVAPVDGTSPAITRAAGTSELGIVLTISSDGDERDALVRVGHPFFPTPWSPTRIGMHLGAATDWGEVTELVTESYCLLAPKKLVDLVARP